MRVKNRFTRKEIGGFSIDSDADLRGANLRDAYLGDADLRDADLRDANLRDAYLRGADLGDADLRGADLGGAYLRDAALRGADLRGADLRGANLRDAYLGGADLRGANGINWPMGWWPGTIVRCSACSCGGGENGKSYTDAKVVFAHRVDDVIYILHEGNGYVLAVTPQEASEMRVTG